MYKNKKILALIPARANSKRLPHKNIMPLRGKPLIAWTLEQAKKSKYIDKIIVSTDSKKIAKISKRYGATVPFLRPKELATVDAKGIDVVLHAIDWLNNRGEVFELLVLLQPTSPLRIAEDIDKTVKLLFLKSAQAIISVCEVAYSPLWAKVLPEDGNMKDFLRLEVINKNRQKLPKFYRINGAVYLAYWNYIKVKKSFLGDKTYAYIMPKHRSVDIDEEIDFKFAELLLREEKSV